MRKSIIASTALVATAVAGTAFATAGPAQADVDRHGSCAGASYELSVDREHRGFEVDADLDGAQPGSRWRIVLRHDGSRMHSRVHTADSEGEIDVNGWGRNTRGADRFKLTVKPVGGASCSTSVTMR